MEVDFDGDEDGNGLAVSLAGLEPPPFDGVDGFGVEAEAERAEDLDLSGASVGVNDEAEGDDTLDSFATSALGELRIGMVNRSWWTGFPGAVDAFPDAKRRRFGQGIGSGVGGQAGQAGDG